METKHRKLRMEALEERAMLSGNGVSEAAAPPFLAADDAPTRADVHLVAYPAAASRAVDLNAVIAENEPLFPADDVPCVPLDGDALTLTQSVYEADPEDPYEIDYVLRESGRVSLLAQGGLQYLSNYVYCAVPDPIYVELWTQALTRWEETFTAGAEDTIYPYLVDGQQIFVDDIYLYFGFSDSYSNSGTLGSSINGGYCRDGGKGLPATGSLVFNAKYFVADPSESVRTIFYNTALHELAHAFGYNLSHMQALDIVESSSLAPYGLYELMDARSNYWYYVGQRGVAEYLSVFPSSLTSLGSRSGFVMETYTSSGSFGAHPSAIYSTYFFNYNQRDGMNYAISASYRATITTMTLAVFQDLGYQVDLDYADAFNSPSPIDVEAFLTPDGVSLTWTKSKGATNSAATFQATYSVQRSDVTADPKPEERVWEVVAAGLTDTQYLDVATAPGRTYLYRVVAHNVRTNVEAGVYKANAGETIYWNSSLGSTSYVYALTNSGANKIAWTRVYQTTTDGHWVVQPSGSSSASTLYRVIVGGAALAITEPSKAVAITVPHIEKRAIVEGNYLLVQAAEYYVPGVEYWWDFSNAKESAIENYVPGPVAQYIDPVAFGAKTEKTFTVRTMTYENGRWSAPWTTEIFVEKSWQGFTIAAQELLDGAALEISLEAKTGRTLRRWAIDWGDDSDIQIVNAAGYALTASHYYETGDASDYAIAFAFIDSAGLYYESEPFKPTLTQSLDATWATLADDDDWDILL